MSTREMICNLVNDSVPNDELELLYQIVLKFIPSDVPEQDELSAIAETKDEINLISHNDIDWD